MRWFINYIRLCFCKHEWELIFDNIVESDLGGRWRQKTYRCKKCGYSKSYKSH